MQNNLINKLNTHKKAKHVGSWSLNHKELSKHSSNKADQSENTQNIEWKVIL